MGQNITSHFQLGIHVCILFPDFEEWKVGFERETNSSFVKTTGEKGLSKKSTIVTGVDTSAPLVIN